MEGKGIDGVKGGDLCNEEAFGLAEDLRKRVEDAIEKSGESFSTRELEKFLVARDNKLENAEKQFRIMIDWRISYGIVDLMKDRCNVLNQSDKISSEIHSKKVFLLGNDKEGRPVVLFRPSHHIPNYQEKTDLEDAIRFWVILEEHLVKQRMSSWDDTGVDKLTAIVDLGGLGMKNFDKKLLDVLIPLFTEYYPERLFRGFIINAPWLFRAIWRIIKPLMDPMTVTRITFLGGEYREELAQVLDPSILPHHHGGPPENHCEIFQKKLCLFLGHSCEHTADTQNELDIFSETEDMDSPYDGTLSD